MKNTSERLKRAGIVLCAFVMCAGLASCGLFYDDYYEDDYYEDDYYEDDRGLGPGRGGSRNDDYDDYYDDDYYDDDYDDYDDSYYDDYYDDNYFDDYSDDDSDYYDNDYYDDYYDEYDDYEDDEDDDSYSGSNTVTHSSGNTNYSGEKYAGNLGSAKELDGTTVIVSVYADDTKTSWTSSDKTTKNNTLKYLGVATDWITEQCAKYNCDAEFIYDWSKNSDLVYTTKFSYDMTQDADSQYEAQMDYVGSSIDSAALMDEYNADNIIYMLFFNTPNSCDTASGTYAWASSDDYPYEVVSIYVRCDDIEENPASYAHEILHTFGAPDLYMADTDGTNYGITQKYVSHLENTESNDIMFTTYDCTTWDSYYDHVSNDFTEVDAYYVGLIDSSSEVTKWGLGESQH